MKQRGAGCLDESPNHGINWPLFALGTVGHNQVPNFPSVDGRTIGCLSVNENCDFDGLNLGFASFAGNVATAIGEADITINRVVTNHRLNFGQIANHLVAMMFSR